MKFSISPSVLSCLLAIAAVPVAVTADELSATVCDPNPVETIAADLEAFFGLHLGNCEEVLPLLATNVRYFSLSCEDVYGMTARFEGYAPDTSRTSAIVPSTFVINGKELDLSKNVCNSPQDVKEFYTKWADVKPTVCDTNPVDEITYDLEAFFAIQLGSCETVMADNNVNNVPYVSLSCDNGNGMTARFEGYAPDNKPTSDVLPSTFSINGKDLDLSKDICNSPQNVKDHILFSVWDNNPACDYVILTNNIINLMKEVWGDSSCKSQRVPLWESFVCENVGLGYAAYVAYTGFLDQSKPAEPYSFRVSKLGAAMAQASENTYWLMDDPCNADSVIEDAIFDKIIKESDWIDDGDAEQPTDWDEWFGMWNDWGNDATEAWWSSWGYSYAKSQSGADIEALDIGETKTEDEDAESAVSGGISAPRASLGMMTTIVFAAILTAVN